MQIRSDILTGIAAFTLLASTGVARADDRNGLKGQFDRGAAQDGRGDRDTGGTRFTHERPALPPERVTNDRPAPPASYERQHAIPGIKSDFLVRQGEGKDKVTPPVTAVAAPPSEEKSTIIEKPAPRIPIKTEVMLRMSEKNGGDMPAADMAGNAASPTASQTKTASKSSIMARTQVKTEIKLRAAGHSDGESDER